MTKRIRPEPLDARAFYDLDRARAVVPDDPDPRRKLRRQWQRQNIRKAGHKAEEYRATLAVRCCGGLHRVTLSTNGPHVFHDHEVLPKHLLTHFRLGEHSTGSADAMDDLGCLRVWMLVSGRSGSLSMRLRETMEGKEPFASLMKGCLAVRRTKRGGRRAAARLDAPPAGDDWQRRMRGAASLSRAADTLRDSYRAFLARPEAPAIGIEHASDGHPRMVTRGKLITLRLPLRWIRSVHRNGLSEVRDDYGVLLVMAVEPDMAYGLLGVAFGRDSWDRPRLFTVNLGPGGPKRLGVFQQAGLDEPRVGPGGVLIRGRTRPGLPPSLAHSPALRPNGSEGGATGSQPWVGLLGAILGA